VIYELNGVTLDAQGQPTITTRHEISLQLPASYPREKPAASTAAMVFHPNFAGYAGGEICIGDFWSPVQSLADIVVTIGEMIQYQNYNTKSPLNAVAARWAAENKEIFPIGTVELFQSEPKISLINPMPGRASSPASERVDDQAVSPDDGETADEESHDALAADQSGSE
jgi:ubiquitin-protein ligase